MKRAETVSCSLCIKLYISIPPYSCVIQVDKLQSSNHSLILLIKFSVGSTIFSNILIAQFVQGTLLGVGVEKRLSS